MPTFEREYQISIGEFGGWRRGLDPALQNRAKRQVHDQVTSFFREIPVPWTLDLYTVGVAYGVHPDEGGHLTIPDEVHLALLRGWLDRLRPLLGGNKPKLWIPEDTEAGLRDVRCCAYTGNAWRACWQGPLHQGRTLGDSSPWMVTLAVKNGGRQKRIEIPILIQASWPCEVPATVRAMTGKPTPIG